MNRPTFTPTPLNSISTMTTTPTIESIQQQLTTLISAKDHQISALSSANDILRNQIFAGIEHESKTSDLLQRAFILLGENIPSENAKALRAEIAAELGIQG